MFVGVISLVFTVVLIISVVTAVRHRRQSAQALDAQSVRRLFQFILLYALVVMTTMGVAELLGRLFGGQSGSADQANSDLGRALAFVVVAGPLAGALGWWIRRSQRSDPSERSSAAYAAYVTVTALTAVLVAATSLPVLFDAALIDHSLDGFAFARVLAWGTLWYAHWLLSRRTLTVAGQTPHLLLGSVLGLVLVSAGFIMTVGESLDILIFVDVTRPPLAGLPEELGTLTAGVFIWVRYWATAAVSLKRDSLWLIYVILFGAGGGLTVTLVAGSQLLWTTLIWVFGDTAGKSATQVFSSAPFEVAAVATGILVWWYHSQLLSKASQLGVAQRIYEHVMAAISLAAVAFGIGTILASLVEAVTPGVDLGMPSINTLLGGITLLLVGAPVWWLYWRRAQKGQADHFGSDPAALTHRVYLAFVLWVAGIAAVVAVIVVSVVLFQDIVNQQLSATTVRSMRYGLGILLASAMVLSYNGAIYQQDRRQRLARGPIGPESVVLVGEPAPELVEAVRRETGARVELWARLDRENPAWDETVLLEALRSRSGEHLLVITGASGVEVISVDLTGGRARQQVPTGRVPESG